MVGNTSESKEKFADLHKETYQFVKGVFLGNTSKVTYKHQKRNHTHTQTHTHTHTQKQPTNTHTHTNTHTYTHTHT